MKSIAYAIILIALVACGKSSETTTTSGTGWTDARRSAWVEGCVKSKGFYPGLRDTKGFCECYLSEITARWTFEDFTVNGTKYQKELSDIVTANCLPKYR